MFSVLFEVRPHAGQWDAYLSYAKRLKPELEQIDGFIDNIRYRSLTREGWLLSLSGWRDEKALVRWRTQALHHGMQEKGRAQTLHDYHLRVGQVTRDTHPPEGYAIEAQRLDETQAGDATTIVLIGARREAEWVKQANAHDVAIALGLHDDAADLVSWDVFDAVLTPGDVILLTAWRDEQAADSYAKSLALPEGTRLRSVRVIRDYGMYDRREAPQYYPDAPRPE
ncbi:antibiotic biosynthesis monooxygenase family protein [Paraburkholderia diazotrophica]|uniref:Heme-degrading monooxygenase HmoA n=1 Tax=Paraburkholderia diazotrophica TaxID=667676 RepID=A0A1H6SW35_9BURK|nr:antibiotic biosynthesis monooxygenase [Paraburkholderia diazotrophica]SEI67772.1 Heme-degrading monooxygenase HmoA [Paraburkholderia diazotrophica]